MLGQLNHEQKSVKIVGAGLSGLLCAEVLSKQSWSVSLFEKADHVGGIISTIRTEKMLSEAAANSFLADDRILKFCTELGVDLQPVRRDSKARYIFRKGRMRRWPLNVRESITLVKKIMRVRQENSPGPDSCMAAWADYHFGQAARRALLDPFCTGIYASNTEDLCIGAVFPQLIPPVGHSILGHLRASRKSKPGVKKSKLQMVSPKNGMEELSAQLWASLRSRPNVQIKTGSEVKNLNDIEGSNVILACPPGEAAQLLHGVDNQLASMLSNIRGQSIISVTVHVPIRYSAALRKKAQGVGVLVAPGEAVRVLGVLFSSSSFDGRSFGGGTVLTVMLGGSRDDRVMELEDSTILEIIKSDLCKIFKCDEIGFDDFKVHRWTATIPCYDRHLYSLLTAKDSFPWLQTSGHVIAGNYTGKIGIRGLIEDAINLAIG